MFDQLRLGHRRASSPHHDAPHRLAPFDIGHTDHGGLQNVRVFDQRLLDLLEADLLGKGDGTQAEGVRLRTALAEREFVLHMQPKVDLRSGRVVGAEALARWFRPGIGFVPPTEFIDVAEGSSLIFELTRWMLYEACERVARWRLLDPVCSLRIAVNLSLTRRRSRGRCCPRRRRRPRKKK